MPVRAWDLLRQLATVALAAGVVSCSTAPSPRLVVENATDLDVAIFVNAEPIAMSPAHGGGGDIDITRLPPLPWNIEARTASGRVIATMEVRPGDLQRTVTPDGAESSSGTIAQAVLSCGRLVMWAGFTAPSVPAPAPNAGTPGDCDK